MSSLLLRRRPLFTSALLLLIACTGISVQTGQPRAAGAQGEAGAPPDATVATSPDQGPPRGHWLKDDQQREYFVARTPKNKAARIDKNTVRNFWGFPLDVVREDDKFYYYKVYKPVAAPKPVPVARISPREERRIRDSYRVNVPPSARLRFTPFGRGLPSSGQWREGFAIADMNGDGHPDIIHGPPRKAPGAGPVIFLGDGKGSWSRWREAKFPPLAYDYGDVQVGDFNGDGHPDLAFAVHLRGLIALLGDGKGGFRDASEGLDFALDGKTAFSSITLRLIDWSGDGRPDILAFGEGPGLMGGHLVHASRGASLYGNLGNGKWERHASAAPDQLFGESIVMGDFDGDGHPGFATSTSVMNRHDIVNLWKPNNGWEAVDVNELRPMAYVWSVAAADFDGDGRTDLAVAYTSFELDTWRSGVDALLSRPGGHWERRPLYAAETRKGPVALATGDLEGDGHKDLVALTATGETLVFLGDGKGSFTREKMPPPAFPGACRGAHVELADLDGDGRDELVASFSDEHDEYGHCPSDGGLTAWKAWPRAGARKP
jgi:hypothetical protein